MTQRIIGLEIGDTEVRVAGLDRKFSGVVASDTAVFRLEGAAGADESLESVLSEISRRFSGDRVNVSLPNNCWAVRKIVLPFDDPGKIEQVLPFELEPQVPFPIEDAVVDSYVISRQKGRTEVLAVALLKSEIARYLGLLKSAGFDPTGITVSPFGVFNYYRYFQDYFGENMIVVDVGATSTSVVRIENGRLVGMRSLPTGAAALTAGHSESEYDGLPDAVVKELNRFMADVGLTIQSLLPGKDEPEPVYLGGVFVPGLKERLEPTLIPSSGTTRKARKLTPLKIEDDMHTAYGLAFSELLGETGLNFRKGAFSHRREVEGKRRIIITATSAAIIILAAGMADLYVYARNMEIKAELYSSQIREKYKEALPESGKIVNEVHQMQAALENLRQKRKILGSESTRITSILAKISGAITSVIDVNELNIDGASLTIIAVTNSFEDVDKISKSLSSVPQFKEVKVSDAKAAAEKGKVNFKISITLSESL